MSALDRITTSPIYQACLAGRTPAEALGAFARGLLVAELAAVGWTDQRIAQHTRMTAYTTNRIRQRLGLPANTTTGVVA